MRIHPARPPNRETRAGSRHTSSGKDALLHATGKRSSVARGAAQRGLPGPRDATGSKKCWSSSSRVMPRSAAMLTLLFLLIVLLWLLYMRIYIAIQRCYFTSILRLVFPLLVTYKLCSAATRLRSVCNKPYALRTTHYVYTMCHVAMSLFNTYYIIRTSTTTTTTK